MNMKINSNRTRLNCLSNNCRKFITVSKNNILEDANNILPKNISSRISLVK